MKLLKTCPILIGIVVVTIALTAASYALEDTTYAEYKDEVDPANLPHFVLVFKGLTDGIYPWSNLGDQYLADAGNMDGADNQNPDGASALGSGDGAEAAQIVDDGSTTAGDQTAMIDISGNSISGNSISGNSISGNSVSGNDADRTYEFQPVDEDYFTDALFIGDSRTVGLSEYCEPLDSRATFYAKVSLTIYGVMDKEFIKDGDSKTSIAKALSERQFGKIYIMLGLNEIGTGTAESFAEEYGKVIDRIRELQPDAIIYIQGIMHVTANKSDHDKYFTNDNINKRNEALSLLADNQTVFYMDMNEAVDDENGNLLKELSFDDVHLKASSYERWYQFLLGHGIVRD